MALQYICDHAHRRVRAVLRREFHAFDIWELLGQQRTDGSWGYRTLVEVRYNRGTPPTDDELRQILEVDARAGAARRGALGILVRGAILEDIARRYAAIAATRRPVVVLTSTLEAEAWWLSDA
jgi:hypothetical protein